MSSDMVNELLGRIQEMQIHINRLTQDRAGLSTQNEQLHRQLERKARDHSEALKTIGVYAEAVGGLRREVKDLVRTLESVHNSSSMKKVRLLVQEALYTRHHERAASERSVLVADQERILLKVSQDPGTSDHVRQLALNHLKSNMHSLTNPEVRHEVGHQSTDKDE